MVDIKSPSVPNEVLDELIKNLVASLIRRNLIKNENEIVESKVNQEFDLDIRAYRVTLGVKDIFGEWFNMTSLHSEESYHGKR